MVAQKLVLDHDAWVTFFPTDFTEATCEQTMPEQGHLL